MASPKKKTSRTAGIETPRHWRIHVVRRAPLRQVVLMLRGPKRVTATYLWDLDQDTFQLGQMLRNNWLQCDESDLSADGQWFSYHAATPNYSDPVSGSDYRVISRPPYLHAVYLDPGYGSKEEAALYPPTPEHLRREFCANVFSSLPREGWTRTAPESTARWHYAKQVTKRWRLVRCMHNSGPEYEKDRSLPANYNSHVLIRDDGLRIPKPDWEWADRDQGQLVFGTKGQILRAQHLNRDGPVEPRVLFDFRDIRFQRIRAPYDIQK
jgi:hypothetical protein